MRASGSRFGLPFGPRFCETGVFIRRGDREQPLNCVSVCWSLQERASSHVICGKPTDGTRDQSYTQEGCAARSSQGSVARVSKQRAHSVGLAAAYPRSPSLACYHPFSATAKQWGGGNQRGGRDAGLPSPRPL
jgi:hypothetical protein